MKFSEKWLREWVSVDADTERLVDKLTLAGIEVDSVTPVAGEFSGVVVGEVVACDAHPNADRLRVTQVSTGSETFQVVCGAPNVRVGLKAPFATVGALLPGDFRIKKAKLRGVESVGMLCSESELGISEAHEGLMELSADAQTGLDVREYLDLDDRIIEIDLTPNRGDCLSIAGLAREVSANFLAAVQEVDVAAVEPTVADTFGVSVKSEVGAPRFVTRVIRDVDVSRPTPLWMAERLRRSGVRSIDPVVDVTAWVMLELGQPMHAYDLDTLNGSLCVRMASEGEQLKLLDGQQVTLDEQTLLIADEQHALGIAGVMGGAHSGVSATTRDILLESAFFTPEVVAGKARRYGIHTDASHRFERGVDYQLQRKAIERATSLILSLCGGSAGPVSEQVSESNLPVERHVTLRSNSVEKVLGVAVDDSLIDSSLTRLGLELAKKSGGWDVRVPSWRHDISIEEDLVEEVGRLYGYENLPESTLSVPLKPGRENGSVASQKTVYTTLVGRGYRETVSLSFIDHEWHRIFTPDADPLVLANPIASDLSVMRASLLPGLVKSIRYNQSRQRGRLRFFERGQTFHREDGEIRHVDRIAAAIVGDRNPESWSARSEAADFYDLKGDVEALLANGGRADEFGFEQAEHPVMHPGQTASVLHKGRVVGYLGALHPRVAKLLGVTGQLFLFEAEYDLLEASRCSVYAPLSRFPEVRRDIALLIGEDVSAGSVTALIEKEAGELLTSVRVFDLYRGEGVGDNQKSLAVGLTLQHASRTLVDEEVNQLMDRLLGRLASSLGASLRG